MQPPPRKVKPNISLKNIHADQVSKLQAKHQQECDLLEDIRTYFARKAALEKEYAQGLQKVTSQLLKRDFPAQPDLSSEDGQEHNMGQGTTVTAVWRSILEESDRLAKARLQASEVYAEKAAEPLKPVKAAKMQCFKKVLPQMSVIQAEVAQCVMEMVKTQKLYSTESGLANDARTKASEAEDKLKRKSTGIFQSLAGLQKSCAKLRARTEQSEIKETSTRNEYLLSLAAANAHHMRYYSTDLPEIMKGLDCDIYEKIQESLTVAGQTAADLAQSEATSFKKIAVEAAKICRSFSLQCYLFQNPVFTNLVQYHFEPCNGDSCNKISSEHGAGPDLEKEARKWSTKVAKETRAIRDYYRQISALQNSKAGDKTSDAGSQESSTLDPEAKLEEVKVHLRKAETAKLKAEARLEALRLGGVNVDEWINQAQMESLAAEESGLARTPSQASLRTESSGGHSGADDQEQTYTHYDEDDDFIDDTFTSASTNRSGRVYPIYCKALYDFVASNYDEMSIKADEDLELIADGDGDGWVKAKNSLGQEGYIPETYVDLGGLSTTPAPLGVDAMNAINTNISSMNMSMASQGSYSMAAATTAPDIQSPDLQQDTTSSYSSGDLEVQQTTEVMGSDDPHVPITVVTSSEVTWARAIYDYEAQADEELSFFEGALIRVIRKDDKGVDDGFWEGECNGNIGVFPSLVVEEIPGPNFNDPRSPPVLPAAPDFSIPPPVQITLPTPDAEPPPPPVLTNGEVEDLDEPLPPPPPPLKLTNNEDSHPVPCSSADQLQKKVRFSSLPSHHIFHSQTSSHGKQQQTAGQHNNHVSSLQHIDAQQSTPAGSTTTERSHQMQFAGQSYNNSHSQPGFMQQKIVRTVNNNLQGPQGSNEGHFHHVRPVHPVQPLQELKAEPSPIMRHKSLPSNLDCNKLEEETSSRSENELCHEKSLPHSLPPQSPQSVRRRMQQEISHSQPQLVSTALRSPPPSRRLILQQRQSQQMQLKHFPSEPSAVNAPASRRLVPQALTLNFSNSDAASQQHRSHSYPSSPLASPLQEDAHNVQSYHSLSSNSSQIQLSLHRDQLLQKYGQSPSSANTWVAHPNYTQQSSGNIQVAGNTQAPSDLFIRPAPHPPTTHSSVQKQLFPSDTHQRPLVTYPSYPSHLVNFPIQRPSQVINQVHHGYLPVVISGQILNNHDDETDDDWEEGEESLV